MANRPPLAHAVARLNSRPAWIRRLIALVHETTRRAPRPVPTPPDRAGRIARFERHVLGGDGHHRGPDASFLQPPRSPQPDRPAGQ